MARKPERSRVAFCAHHRQGISLSADWKPWIDFEKTCGMDLFCKGVPRKKPFAKANGFFQWNSFLTERVKYADACEIACGSEIRLRRVKERILFHIDQSRRRREIFHNFRKEIISHFAVRQNISLKIKNSEYHSEYAKNYFTFGARRIFHLKN